MLFAAKSIIGLDIGTSSIKLAELQLKKNTASLVGFHFAATPPGSIVGGDIVDSDALSQAIQQIKAEFQSKSKSVAVSVWGTSVIVKRINIPAMDEKLLREQIKWEAEQYIPYDVSEVNLEYYILKNQVITDSMEVLLIAAKQSQLMNYAEVIESSGFSCRIVDVAGFALANCYEQNYGRQEGQCLGILNIGASSINFVVLDDGELVFSRDIPVGGLTYTSDIQKQMGVSIDEAESLKLSATGEEGAPSDVLNILRATNEVVAEEIQRSVDFFNASNNSGKEISRYYLSGGSMSLPHLKEDLSHSLNAQIDVFNPFQRITYDMKKFSSDYIMQISSFISVALGLALRKEGDS